MRRVLVSTLALGGALAGLLPAAAGTGQPVDVGQAAGVSVTGQSPDGQTLQIGITGYELSTGPRLALTIQRCDEDGYCDGENYVSPLTGSDFVVDANATTASLHTTLSGQPLVITWAPSAAAGPGAEIGATQLEMWGGADGSAVGWFGRSADATVRYAGVTCSTDGGVGAGTIADTEPIDGNPTTPAVSALRLRSGAPLHC